MPQQPKQHVSETASQRIKETLRPLSSEHRLEIMQALQQTPGQTATFSELRDAVSISDSGQFSYHLRQLTEDFIRQTDSGYELRIAGIVLYRAILSGIALEEVSPRSFTTGSDCPDCVGTLEATYENDALTISCPKCGVVLHEMPFPPGTVEGKTDAAILRTFDRRMRSFIELSTSGVCPWCFGTMRQTLTFDDEMPFEHRVTGHFVRHTCERCAGYCMATVGETLLTHPAIVSFFYNHGRDITEIPLWEFDFCMEDRPITVVSEEPLRMTVDVELDGDTLQLTVDEQLSVVDSTTVLHNTHDMNDSTT